MPSTPQLVVEFAPTNDPGDASPTWVDISAYVRAFSTQRGRQTELDRIEAGTATLVLDNQDQRFDPNNASGPYYGDLKPMKRLRIRAVWDSVSYPIFSGLIESWPQEYPGRVDAIARLRCVDAFKALNLCRLTSSYSSEVSGTRVNNVLTSAGWPTGSTWRDVDTGQSTVQAATLDGAALEHLQETVASENGLFFISRDGKATFIDRHTLLTTSLDTDLTFGDDGTDLPYLDIGFRDTDVSLWNDVQISAPSLATQTATDAASITSYFRRTLTRSTLLTTTNDMSDVANFLVTKYAEPATRVDRLVVTGMADTSIWPQILDREIGHLIRVKRDPGTAIQQDCVIEGIRFDATPENWRVTWTLSPTTGAQDYWTVEDAVFSLLDSTTRLAY